MTLIVCARAIASARGATGLPADAARVALFDPEGRAAPALRALGLRYAMIAAPEELTLFEGDLIIVGPGGFCRGHETLGPVLAARLRGGLPVLLLDQPSLPATLSDDLRLWPSFDEGPDSEVAIASGHPVMHGLSGSDAAAYLREAGRGARLLLPPTRGNFKVLAEVRSGGDATWQEGISVLEIRVGGGTLLAVQVPLCGDSARDPRALRLLGNAIGYLAGDRPAQPRAALLGSGPESLPLCLQQLAPYLPPAPTDLSGVELLVAPADWQALRASSDPSRPPLARVSRFLREGGTLVLLNPQSLVLGPLSALTGASVSFETTGVSSRPATGDLSAPALFQGVSARDLALLEQPGRPELRLRPSPGERDGVEPLQIEPGLARYRVGRGTLVALTIPDAARCAAAPVSSLLARLLTNLGVPLDADPGPEKRAITRLDESGD